MSDNVWLFQRKAPGATTWVRGDDYIFAGTVRVPSSDEGAVVQMTRHMVARSLHGAEAASRVWPRRAAEAGDVAMADFVWWLLDADGRWGVLRDDEAKHELGRLLDRQVRGLDPPNIWDWRQDEIA